MSALRQRTLIVSCIAATIGAAATPAAAPPDAPALNTLRAVVVSATDGTPLAGVQVVMVHAQRGYLYVSSGDLAASGEPVLGRELLASRNGRTYCDTYTAEDGSFTLRSFTEPDAHWILAAGDRTHGIALLARIVPADFADAPLRVEVEPPAYLSIPELPESARECLNPRLTLSILEDQPGVADAEAFAAAAARMGVYASPRKSGDGNLRVGPLPPGYTYRLTYSLWHTELRYDVTLFEQTAVARSGQTQRLSLAPGGNLTLSGRITDARRQPLADVNVVVRTDGADAIAVGALSDADGRYALSHLPAAPYTLELVRHVKPTAPT